MPAVWALYGPRALTLLLAMHWVMNAVRPGLVGPGAALYVYWMEWRTSKPVRGAPVQGYALRLTSEGSATSRHSSAQALPHALSTRLSMYTAPYLSQARATYPGEMSELDRARHLLHPRD